VLETPPLRGGWEGLWKCASASPLERGRGVFLKAEKFKSLENLDL